MPFDLTKPFTLNISPEKLLEVDRSHKDVSEPAPYRTLGDVIELERRRREHESLNRGKMMTGDVSAAADPAPAK